jgi:hypothetical protein
MVKKALSTVRNLIPAFIRKSKTRFSLIKGNANLKLSSSHDNFFNCGVNKVIPNSLIIPSILIFGHFIYFTIPRSSYGIRMPVCTSGSNRTGETASIITNLPEPMFLRIFLIFHSFLALPGLMKN